MQIKQTVGRPATSNHRVLKGFIFIIMVTTTTATTTHQERNRGSNVRSIQKVELPSPMPSIYISRAIRLLYSMKIVLLLINVTVVTAFQRQFIVRSTKTSSTTTDTTTISATLVLQQQPKSKTKQKTRIDWRGPQHFGGGNNLCRGRFRTALNTASATTSTKSSKSLPSRKTNRAKKITGANDDDGDDDYDSKQKVLSTAAAIDNNDNGDDLKKIPNFDSSSSIDDDDTIEAGFVGEWEYLHGNWVLRPLTAVATDSSNYKVGNTSPRAVIHFLGGAIVGKAPHITYRFLLERLAAEGFLIIATPYDLSFDHLATCDDVLTKFDDVAPTLARQYGALPVVGTGHSCGALLQVLISSLFPDTPRAANALISFNNKPVKEAVPFFEELFAPAFSSLATTTTIAESPQKSSYQTDISSASGSSDSNPPSPIDSFMIGLKFAKSAIQGKLPSDELLNEVQRVFTSGIISQQQQQQHQLMSLIVDAIPVPLPTFFVGKTKDHQQQRIKIPHEIRNAYSKLTEPAVTTLKDVGLLPLLYETIVTLEQVPKLIDEVANGARDFNPTPAMVRSVAGKAYHARRTLIIGYDNDSIDESEEIEEVLREAKSITRMRRPMVEIDVQLKTLNGVHASPLIAPPVDVAEQIEDLIGSETSQEQLRYWEAAETVKDLVRWLDEGNF